MMTLLGGAAFVASLAYCAWTYIVTWGTPRAGSFSVRAAAIDLLLLAAFAAHHSIAARQRVKERMAALVGADGVRTSYVWLASGLLTFACAAWRPVGCVIYQHGGARAWVHAAIQLGGLGLLVASVRQLDPLELAGLRPPGTALRTSGVYGWVRHPLYAGWMIMTFGAATMTADRLAFAVISSAYLLVAVPWEEASMRRHFGDGYQRYSRAVRWRVIPFVY